MKKIERIGSQVVYKHGNFLLVEAYKLYINGEPMGIVGGEQKVERGMLKDRMMMQMMSDSLRDKIKEKVDEFEAQQNKHD